MVGLATALTHKVTAEGGAITWDTPVDLNGTLSQTFLDQIKALGAAFSLTAALHLRAPRSKKVDRPAAVRYSIYAGWSSPVARWAHNPKVADSNPAPATNQINNLR